MARELELGGKKSEAAGPLPLEEELVRQIRWFIGRRWLAGSGGILVFLGDELYP